MLLKRFIDIIRLHSLLEGWNAKKTSDIHNYKCSIEGINSIYVQRNLLKSTIVNTSRDVMKGKSSGISICPRVQTGIRVPERIKCITTKVDAWAPSSALILDYAPVLVVNVGNTFRPQFDASGWIIHRVLPQKWLLPLTHNTPPRQNILRENR